MAKLLVKVRGDGQAFAAATTNAFGAAAVTVEPILHVPAAGGAALGVAGPAEATWLSVSTAGHPNPWNEAYRLLAPGEPFAVAGAGEI